MSVAYGEMTAILQRVWWYCT